MSDHEEEPDVIMLDVEEQNSINVSQKDSDMNKKKLSKDQLLAMAEAKKEEGNKFYSQKNYYEAIRLYTEAINTCPDHASFYGNRAAAYVMLAKYREGLEDAKESTRLDPTFVKGFLREAKCCLALGLSEQTVRILNKILEIDTNNRTAQAELRIAKELLRLEGVAEKSFEKGDYRHVVFSMDRAIEKAPGCFRYKTFKAECLVYLKRYQEAQEIVNDLLHRDQLNSDAVYVRGLCLYYQDNVEKAMQHFQQVLRLNPDHTPSRNAFRKSKLLKAKKEEGNEAFKGGRLEEAYRVYSQALDIDPLNVFINAKLHNNRATVAAKLGRLQEALQDCNAAIRLDDTYLKAYLRRAKCYMDLEQYEEAVRDYEKIYQMDKTGEHRSLLQKAKLELKKSKRKDYYKILGVNKQATEDEIKKGYRKRALIHHPDRHSNSTAEEKKEEEKKFKEVGEAYAVLSDPKKKSRYDSGADLDELDGTGFGEFDPNTIFQAFFGGGGGPGGGFSFGGPGGFPGRGGYPSGGGFEFRF